MFLVILGYYEVLNTDGIHIPTIARCVFVYATKEEMQEMQKEYTALSLQTVTALYQSQ